MNDTVRLLLMEYEATSARQPSPVLVISLVDRAKGAQYAPAEEIGKTLSVKGRDTLQPAFAAAAMPLAAAPTAQSASQEISPRPSESPTTPVAFELEDDTRGVDQVLQSR